MKKHFMLLFFLSAFVGQMLAQEFFICTGNSFGQTTSTLRKVQLPTCSSQLKANLTQVFNDITFHPSGKLYGVEGNGLLYELDTLTGRQTFVINFLNGGTTGNFNSLTADAQGNIYAATQNGKLYTYNPQTGSASYLGIIQVDRLTVQAAGDLTFYRGNLFVASTSGLVQINLANPANSTLYMTFGTSFIYGIVSFVDCGQVITYATTGDAAGVVYRIDWVNRVLVNVCQTNQTIFGGASRYEFKASTAALDTTRITNYTCDRTQTKPLTTRVLRNQLGCDSTIFEKTDFVKPDTLENTRITCDRAQVRTDTLRLQNIRGCDSIVITGVKLGTDSIVSAKQICRGDSVNFYNQWLKNTGSFVKIFVKASGCDSNIVLNLTVFDKQTTVRDSFVCQANQVRRDTVAALKTFVGCDSFVVRNQLIAPRLNDKTPLNKLICKGDVVNIGQNRFYTEGSFSVVLKNVFGCDSTINLSLRYLRSDSVVTVVETCDASKVKDSIKVFKNQLGCDSTFIIRRKLIPNPNQITGLPIDVKLVIGDSVALLPQLNFTPNLIRWTPPKSVNCDTCLTTFSRVRQSSTVRFFAKDARDCPVQQDIKFLVDPNRRVYMPTAFSPNSDKTNDVFTLYGDGNLALILNLKIFDRWGEQVFTGENLKPNVEGWDGTFKGQVLPPDVYVFWAKLRFKDGEDVIFKGDVTLVK
jgi:gliding motility-associated-like protein